jgi:orotate phosphoribosyltransferase
MSRLLDLLREKSFARRRVTLASGRESDFFIDCKQTVLLAEGHALVGAEMFDALALFSEWPSAVAGVELGGCPLASAVAFHSFRTDRGVDAIYVRKDAKDHGSKRQLEGDGHLPTGSPVVVLEDVVTSGGSTLKAVRKLRERGFRVLGVVTLVDRLEGAREAIEAEDLRLVSLYAKSDFMEGA